MTRVLSTLTYFKNMVEFRNSSWHMERNNILQILQISNKEGNRHIFSIKFTTPSIIKQPSPFLPLILICRAKEALKVDWKEQDAMYWGHVWFLQWPCEWSCWQYPFKKDLKLPAHCSSFIDSHQKQSRKNGHYQSWKHLNHEHTGERHLAY